MSHLTEEDLILHYYGETDNPVPVAKHLDACPACRAAYGSLERVLNAMDAIPVPERAAGYEAAVWGRVSPRLPVAGRFGRWWTPPWRWAAAGAALASLLAAAFWAGRISYLPHGQQPPAAHMTADAQLGEGILKLTVGDYLDRSGIVLTELANASSTSGLDISAEQERAASLLAECRLYHQTAVRAQDNVVAGVLDELERMLLEIDHAPSRLQPEQVDELRQRLRAQGVLFRIRVLSSTVRNQGEHKL